MSLQSVWRKGCRLAASGALALGMASAHADTAVAMYRSIAGKVNFTGIEASLRTSRSGCSLASSASKDLSSLPSGAKVEYARLYWAGSGAIADTQVKMDGQVISAQRQFSSRIQNGFSYFDYFGGVADVTAKVAAKGNGTYTFSDLTVDTSSSYCNVGGILGGFAILVVYSVNSETFRVLNLYEGFQSFRYTDPWFGPLPLTLSIGNFRTPNPLNGATGRIGHITWEGDPDLNQDGENLKFNSTVMTDSYNPDGNQFNSVSNIDAKNKNDYSYGIDFDAYVLGSSLIYGGMTSATTTYSSGQDLVILTAEIVAMPNIPVADLSVLMSRAGSTAVGGTASYAVQIMNNGPNTEPGPVKISTQLSAGLKFASYSGTGWSCSLSANNSLGTCTYTGALTSGVGSAVLTINTTVTAVGTQINTATITATSGQVFDNVSANNTATDTMTATVPISAGYAITVGRCAAGYVIGAAGSNCTEFAGPLIAGDSQSLYVTLVDASNKTVGAASPSWVTLYAGISCVDPASASTVRATIGGTAMPACLANGAETGGTGLPSISLPFMTGEASSGAPFIFGYQDAGKLKLLLYASLGGAPVASADFVVQPLSLGLSVMRPGGPALTGMGGGPGLVAAGDPFTMRITAFGRDGSTALPNFGKESTPLSFVRSMSILHGTGTLTGSFSAGTGAYAGTFSFSDAGDIRLSYAIASPQGDYLGSGVAVAPTVTTTVGTFYPAAFVTTPLATFSPCLPHMNCPTGNVPTTGESLEPTGGVYSGQPFIVNVTALNADGDPLNNYKPAIGQAITLSAVTKPGPTGAAVAWTVGALGDTAALTTATSAANWPNGLPKFTLIGSYLNLSPNQVSQLKAPLTIYLRATATVSLTPSGTATISSLRSGGVTSQEGGVQVMMGRLRVGSAAGSELLRLGVPLDVQYWSGSAWENSSLDNGTLVSADAGKVSLASCRNGLVGTGAFPNNCNGAAATEGGNIAFSGGKGTLWLRAPGAGRAGSVDITLSSGNPAWLPSTTGRAVFGGYKSPLIYLREIY